MTLLRQACASLYLATLVAATKPGLLHEARQGGPVQTVTSTSTSASTMPPTSTTHSPTGTSPATPSSSPTLIVTVRNMTTCTPGFISWNYSGKAADLFLSITDIGVDQNYPLPRVKARQAFQEQLVDTNTTVQNWTWPAVNVPQGWYQIQASVPASPTISNNSAPFFVSNGTDVSCLAGTSSQASSTASASASVSPGGSKTNVSGIVAGVVGTVVGLAVAVLTGVWLWKRGRRRRSMGEGGSSRDRKWGSLKSTTSSYQPGGGETPCDHYHSRTESTGAMLQAVADGNTSATSTPGDSEEDVTTTGEEKLVSPVSSGMSPVDALSTPMRYDRRSSIQSVQTPTSAASDASRTRTASLHASNHNHTLEQQAHRIRSSMEASVRRRGERLSMPTVPSPGLSRPPYYQSKDEYPLSNVTATPVNRSISAGAVPMTARRASRKPVPHYDSSVLLEDTNTDSVSTFTGGADSSQSHGTGMATGGNGVPPDLVHKASFGDGRPLHYLIPDMPPPQQDQD